MQVLWQLVLDDKILGMAMDHADTMRDEWAQSGSTWSSSSTDPFGF